MRKTLLLALLSVTAALPSAALAQEDIVIVNPTECQFDKDGVPDTWRTIGKRGFAGLSARGTERRIPMDRAWKHFTCTDRNGDGISEIVGRMVEGGTRRQVLDVANTGNGGLSKVCRSVQELKPCQIWKSQQSEHISRGDPRHLSTGFITLRGCPDAFPNPLIAYDKKGAPIHKLGEYFPSGALYDSRHYGGTNPGDRKDPVDLAREAARRNGNGDESIFLKSETGVCYRVPDPGQCYNSSAC
jgi:hypothetical protein